MRGWIVKWQYLDLRLSRGRFFSFSYLDFVKLFLLLLCHIETCTHDIVEQHPPSFAQTQI